MHGLTGERTLMRIHIGERDKYHGKPLYEAIVLLLRERGFAGATVLRGIMGFGASAGIHSEKVLRLSLDLPLIVECVDTEEKIQAILPELDGMIGGGLITLERAQRRHVPGRPGPGKAVMSTPVQALQGVPNACQLLPTVVTGGQPSAAHLAAFKAAGGQVVLDLRDPMEPRPLDEAATVASLGHGVRERPGRRAARLTDATLDRVLDVLRQAGDRLVLVHCGSGNRVGGALLPYLMLDQGLEEEDAVGQAMRVGLRSAELLEWGLDYARRNRPA